MNTTTIVTGSEVLNLKASDTILLKNVKIEGSKGSNNGKINYSSRNLIVKDSVIAEDATIYNVFEGNQKDVTTKKVLIDNLSANTPNLKHNILNTYQPEDNAEIIIQNSDFNLNVANSNIMRVSNYKNANNVTIKFKNINWTYENVSYSKSDAVWAGLLLYQPANNDSALSGDLSNINTWTVIIENCYYNGKHVTSNNFGEISQCVYFYNIGGSKLIEDPAKYGITLKFI